MGEFWKFRFWDWTWYSKSQKEIQGWELPDEVNEKLQKISEALPPFIRKYIMLLITKLYTRILKKYGKEFVKGIINTIIEFLKELANGLRI